MEFYLEAKVLFPILLLLSIGMNENLVLRRLV